MTARPCAMVLFAAGLLLLPGLSRGELRDRVMVLDQQMASVKEIHRLAVRPGMSQLPFEDLPNSVDPASLALHVRRGRLELIRWVPLVKNPVEESGQPVWPLSRATESGGQQKGWAAECMMRSGGDLTVELHYLCTNLSWSARYDLGLRFTSNLEERVSCDVRALIEIQNRTDMDFSNTVVRLLQTHQAQYGAREIPQRAPGFLSLDPDSPLADFWMNEPRDSGIRKTYRLPDRVHLRPGQVQHLTLVDSTRSKATRMYRYRLGRFHRIMQIHNTRQNGLGWPLPTGPVYVFNAGNRRPLTESGVLAQTDVDDYVEIDLGPTKDIDWELLPEQKGSRRAGQVEVHTQIRIINHLPFVVPVQWEYSPESSLQWRVLNSNVEHEIREGFLLLSDRVPAEDSRMMDFTLEFVQPAF